MAGGATVSAQTATLWTGREMDLDPNLTGRSRDRRHYERIRLRREHFAQRQIFLRVCHRLEIEETATREPHARQMLNVLIAVARAEYDAFCLSWRP